MRQLNQKFENCFATDKGSEDDMDPGGGGGKPTKVTP